LALNFLAAPLARAADAKAPSSESSTPAKKARNRGQALSNTDLKGTSFSREAPAADSVTQEIRVEDKFVLAKARIHWTALKGQILPILFDPAVLTEINYPSNSIKLIRAEIGSTNAQQLFAQESGRFD